MITEEKRAYQRAYYRENKQIWQQYYRENRDKRLQYAHLYNAAHPYKRVEKKTTPVSEQTIKRRDYKRRWYQMNKKRIVAKEGSRETRNIEEKPISAPTPL